MSDPVTNLTLSPELTTQPTETALAEALAGHGIAQANDGGAAYELMPYLGTLTPRNLDAAEAETAALLTGAAVHDLGWLRRVAVRGEDRSRWLSGMATNDVETLAKNAGAYNLVLNAQGRIQGDAYVWREGEQLEVETTADQVDTLLAHFDKFIIMDDVELVQLKNCSAIGLTGPQAAEILEKVGLAELLSQLSTPLSTANGVVGGLPALVRRLYGTVVPHYALWVESAKIMSLWQTLRDAGATAAGAEAVEALRVAEGIPMYGVDIQSRDLAQETDQSRALSFTKGCYLGQEIVERVRSRGQVHRHLRLMELHADGGTRTDLPPRGTEIRTASTDAKPAGTLTSVASLQPGGVRRIFAIGMVQATAELGRQTLCYPGGTAEILKSAPKFIAADAA